MNYISVDVESDGPLQGYNSMVCFGAVLVDKKLDKTFYGETAPIIIPTVSGLIHGAFDKEALSISGFTREQHLGFNDPAKTMSDFAAWLEKIPGKKVLVSDNNGYDAAWINWYFHSFLGRNPFGWSSRRIGDMFCGFFNDPFYKWKKHRKTSHTHNPVDDAKGNAEALLYLINQGFKLKI